MLDFCVRVNHRDVCTHYFPSVGNELNPTGVDAIILDLPKPWIIIPHVPKSFNPSSGIVFTHVFIIFIFIHVQILVFVNLKIRILDRF